MRQSYKIIPVYTADVSGVCSALYELGGMVVMHDPSGCNSTYNTHDEIRWYDQDSLIFISGLSEIDAVMGNDAKFIHDIEEAARELKPKFIALAGSPIPFMNGTDFPAIAQVIETETGIPAFAVPTNGMHDYTYGAGLALAKIAERFVEERQIRPHTLNILGATPLDFGPQENVDAMKQKIAQYGWEVLSTWAMGDSLETLSLAGAAEVNLVVSSVGIPAAKVLEEKFGTPYIIGTPIGEFAEELVQELRESEEITLIGEAVTMRSLASEIEKKYHRAVRVICPLETHEGLLGENDRVSRGEEEMEELLKDSRIIVADPLYRPICPKGSQFYELPHVAFSGRIFLKNTKKYIDKQNFWCYDEKKRERRFLEMKTLETKKAPAAIGPYSQAKMVGNFLFASGQIPVDPATGEVAGDKIETQAEQSCKNVGAILEEAGLGYDNVVKTTCFLADMADFAAFNAVYEKYFTSKPARSCVAVKQLPKNVLCEVEVIAVAE